MRVGTRMLPLLLLCACGGDDAAPSAPRLTQEELRDPASCAGCHPKHYREWQSSMHAYASEDPVFIAMNQRGQRETDGRLGDFCVRCHAPMAAATGASSDGLNLAELPDSLRGVTCYFCHSASESAEAFNNHVRLADDGVLRAALTMPADNGAHASGYSSLHDRNRAESSALCGGCHDVVNQHGVAIERTFVEYRASLFAESGLGFETCSGCHMPGRPGRAAENVGVDTPTRIVHEHLWPGVDVALTAFPDQAAQRAAVECMLSANTRIYSVLHEGFGRVTVALETSAGHGQPSGTAQDRRLWLELVAYDDRDEVVFESGRIADGELEDKPIDDPAFDPQLTLYRDYLFDAAGEPVHMFWEAEPSDAYPDGYVGTALPAARALNTPHTLETRYQIPEFERVAYMTLQLRMRPVGRDVLDDLVRSGDLAAEVRDAMPTFTLYGAAQRWDPVSGALESLWPDTLDCPDAYRCLLEPSAEGC